MFLRDRIVLVLSSTERDQTKERLKEILDDPVESEFILKYTGKKTKRMTTFRGSFGASSSISDERNSVGTCGKT